MNPQTTKPIKEKMFGHIGQHGSDCEICEYNKKIGVVPQSMTTDKRGNWIPATPEPYSPSFILRIGCFFGKHHWAPNPPKSLRRCFICSKED